MVLGVKGHFIYIFFLDEPTGSGPTEGSSHAL